MSHDYHVISCLYIYIYIVSHRSMWGMRTYIHINLCVCLSIAQLLFVIAVDKTAIPVSSYTVHGTYTFIVCSGGEERGWRLQTLVPCFHLEARGTYTFIVCSGGEGRGWRLQTLVPCFHLEARGHDAYMYICILIGLGRDTGSIAHVRNLASAGVVQNTVIV